MIKGVVGYVRGGRQFNSAYVWWYRPVLGDTYDVQERWANRSIDIIGGWSNNQIDLHQARSVYGIRAGMG